MTEGYEQTTDVTEMTAVQLGKLYERRQISPVEVTKQFLDKIEKLNSSVNAYCHVDEALALKAARESEQRWVDGKPQSPIDGIPSSIKDLTYVEGMPNRSGSLTSQNQPISVDAPFTARMKEAGAVILGKTTTPEFGWKGVTDSPLTGITRNPWNLECTSGGSSGGAAAAAALNMGILHQGSDAGGSIRIPASFCGVFGIKPTFGFIPQWPSSAMMTLSHLGPITRNVDDSMLMMDAVAKLDNRDWYSYRQHHGRWQVSEKFSLKGLRVAYSPTLGYVDVDPGVQTCIEGVVRYLEQSGAQITEIDPGFEDPIDIFSTLWFAGAAKVVDGMSKDMQSKLDPGFLEIGLLGKDIDIVEYMRATDKRAELGKDMQLFHEQYDLLVTPTLPITAFEAGKNTSEPSQRHWMDWTPFSYPFNLTQQPASSVPCGLVKGLPVGIQLIANRGNDLLTVNVAKIIEAKFGFAYPW